MLPVILLLRVVPVSTAWSAQPGSAHPRHFDPAGEHPDGVRTDFVSGTGGARVLGVGRVARRGGEGEGDGNRG